MSKIKNELAVGILFFVSLIILGYFTIVMREGLWETKEFYFMNVKFPAIFGLKVGDNVQILGVDSGVVDSIILKNNNVFVKLKMYVDFELFESYKIKIRSQSALGGKYVSIDPGDKVIKDNTYAKINNKEEFLLSGIESGDLIGMLEDIVAENRVAINETFKNMNIITQELRMITHKINRGDGTIGKLINTDSVHTNTDDLIKELRETIEDSREQAPITSFIRAAMTAL